MHDNVAAEIKHTKCSYYD